MQGGDTPEHAFPMPSFAPASSNMGSNVPTITAADLHELFSMDFAAFTPSARKITAPGGSHAVDPASPMAAAAPGAANVYAMAEDAARNALSPATAAPVMQMNAIGGKSAAAMAEAARKAQGGARGKRRRPDAAGDTKTEAKSDVALADFLTGGSAGLVADAAGLISDDHRLERRLRNREHAKRSRLRKRFLLESLQSQVTELRGENKVLRELVKDKMPQKARQILQECTMTQSDLLEDLNGQNKLRPRVALPNATTANDSGAASTSNGHNEPDLSRQLVEQDYRLIRALQHSQQCFAISDPALPDNPIVYASQGFLELTGYSMRQVLGRNCRFLQGPGTDQRAVQEIRDGIAEGRDVTVCLLNYKADGTPFWNQFFIAPLSAASGEVVNFVGVQCEVASNKAEDMQQRVKKIKNIEDYVDES